jgi:hypothetical protein
MKRWVGAWAAIRYEPRAGDPEKWNLFIYNSQDDFKAERPFHSVLLTVGTGAVEVFPGNHRADACA